MKSKFYSIGIRKTFFGKPKKARNAIEGILHTTSDTIFQKGKDFFNTLESKSLDLVSFRGVWLEKVIAHVNSAITDFQKQISASVAQYKKAVRKSYYKQRELYDLISLKDESELVEPDHLEEIQEDKVLFQESKIKPQSVPDEVYIRKYELSDKPNRFKPIEFNRHLNEEIDESAYELGKTFRTNFQHLEKTELPEPVVPEIFVPRTFNILNYFKTVSVVGYFISAFVGIFVEGLIWYLTGRNVMNLDSTSAIIIAFGPMVVVSALVLFCFKRIEVYLRTIAKIPTVFMITVAVTVLVVLSFGVLSAFHTDKKAETAQTERLAEELTQKQGELFLDDENTALKVEIAELQKEINERNSETKPWFIKLLSYIALSLFGICMLLCSLILKIVLIIAGKVVYLRYYAELYTSEVDRIVRDYPVWYQQLENAYILRNELVHLVCKKHICEQLLMQNPEDKEYNL